MYTVLLMYTQEHYEQPSLPRADGAQHSTAGSPLPFSMFTVFLLKNASNFLTLLPKSVPRLIIDVHSQADSDCPCPGQSVFLALVSWSQHRLRAKELCGFVQIPMDL